MRQGNHEVIDLKRNYVALSCIAVIFVSILFQLILFAVDDPKIYWNLYDTSSDFVELIYSIALFSLISYSAVQLKLAVSCLTVWNFYGLFSQFATDYLFQQSSNNIVLGLFATVFVVVAFLARFIIRWRVSKTHIESNCFYEVIGKPTNFSQLIVAMYSGRGGAFGITDGVNLWHYSKEHDGMICEEFKPTYLMGRMVKKICIKSKEKHNELNVMTGQKFTVMHNCLELHALAGKWR